MAHSLEQWLPMLAMYAVGSIVPAVVIGLGLAAHAWLTKARRPVYRAVHREPLGTAALPHPR